jgi:hypothetical protein
VAKIKLTSQKVTIEFLGERGLNGVSMNSMQVFKPA